MSFKKNDGYSLPLVLVVLAVLALIATGLMTLTISNMRSQEKQIERMEQQYQAQGKLEKVLAEMTFNAVVELSGAGSDSYGNAVKKILSDYCTAESGVSFPEPEADALDMPVSPTYEFPFTYQFQLSAADDDGEVMVTYSMKLSGRLVRSEGTVGVYLFIITAPQLTCESISVEVTA